MRTVSIRPSAVRPVMSVTSAAPRCSIGISPDPVIDAEIDGRRRHRDIERHAVVVRGERLQIGADLVADVAVGGRAVGADDARDRPGRAASDGRRCCRGSRCAARRDGRVPRPSARRPGCAGGSRRPRHASACPRSCAAIDRRGRGAPVDGRQPAGVAMGQHVDGLAGCFCAAIASISARPCRPIAWLMATSSSADLAGARIGRRDARRAAAAAAG